MNQLQRARAYAHKISDRVYLVRRVNDYVFEIKLNSPSGDSIFIRVLPKGIEEIN
jgi:hypothetical protein